jgi:hypothetical protein
MGKITGVAIMSMAGDQSGALAYKQLRHLKQGILSVRTVSGRYT